MFSSANLVNNLFLVSQVASAAGRAADAEQRARQADADADYAAEVGHDWRDRSLTFEERVQVLERRLADALADAAGLRALADAYQAQHPDSPLRPLARLIVEAGRELR